MEALLELVPSGTRALCEALANEPCDSRNGLLHRTRAYLTTVEAAAGQNEFLDLPLARAIAVALEQALDHVDPSDERALHALHVAVRYFEEDDDDEPDLESVLGFEDDAQVANVVLRFIGREDLLIEIP